MCNEQNISPIIDEELTRMRGARARICQGCWQKMHMPVPLRGVVSAPFRACGIRPSRMKPNICTICETMFAKLMKARQVTIDATVLFADLRGYTRLSQTNTSETISEVLDAFYDECAEAIWEHHGLLNKTMGDAVMAIFNFPIRHEDHPTQAVLAAQDIQRRWTQRLRSLGSAQDVGVGVGVDCGEVSFGEFGRTHHDLTAIGTIVNRGSRAQSATSSGEILVTEAVRDRVPDALEQSAP
jgi:class 3 adenylate cyclase